MSFNKSFTVFKELLKTAPNGQWSLEKAWVKDESDSTPAKNMRTAYPTMGNAFHPNQREKYHNSNKVLQTKNKIALDDMMDLIDKGGLAPNQFHDFIRKAPKSSIDFGHIFDKVKGNPKFKSLVRNSDFDDSLSHHLDGVRDLKDIHDHHGGLDAVEGILKHYHGANGQPSEYNSLNFGKNNKKIHAESQDLVNPGKGEKEYPSVLDSNKRYFKSLDPKDRPDYSKHIDPELDKETREAYDKAQDDDGYDPDYEGMKNHGRAAIKRAMDAFKKYHKL